VDANEAVVRSNRWDVVIVGAGPAGLSAALVLGRARRKVLLCDRGTPRNWAAKQMHGFITRDGTDPRQFRAQAHQELGRYPSVTFRKARVTSAAQASGGGFDVTLRGRTKVWTRKLLLATGVFDILPPLQGIERFYGTSVFQCPYCDGWEIRDQPVAIYGKRQRGFEMARALTAWTSDIVLCTDGPSGLSRAEVTQLERNGIRLRSERIARLRGRDGQLDSIEFREGGELPRSALFFDTPSHEQSDLAKLLGCEFTRSGGIKCGEYETTSVPGVFAAGNIIRDVQLVIVAAAEGTRAAFGINRALTREDFESRAAKRAGT
jgi:thioredoxin reductase